MKRRKINISDTRNGNGVNFEIPLADDFATNLHQGDLLSNNYIEEIKENSINKIVNYEKYMFYPAYLDKSIAIKQDGSFIDNGQVKRRDVGKQPATTDLDEHVHDVSKINFHLYLKHREQDENNDYGSWESSDEFYWNRWDGTKNASDKKALDNIHSTEKNGDLLGCLGFTDEDVFYQKNSLKKSFLRISIYDSPYRQTQKLLYYATLFFDTNALYKKYVNLNNYARTAMSYSMTIKLPSPDSGSIIRFTFDNVTDASNSQYYIEGTYNYDFGAGMGVLNNVMYSGITCSNGSTWTSVPDGIFDIFTIHNIATNLGERVSTSYMRQWSYFPSTKKWQINSEFDVSSNKDGNEIQRVYEYSPWIPDEEKLTATFTCTTKNDDSACSDGFYLYLFNTIVNTGKCTQLYMKVEFNNAKYGKTVVLTNPRLKKVDSTEVNDQILLDSDAFPEDYEVIHGSNGNSYVDVNKFYDDLYIPIFVRYNNKLNRYEWYIASNEQYDKTRVCGNPDVDPDIVDIYLFEPRINKLK